MVNCADLVADLFQIRVGQILDLLGVVDAASFANFAGAGATNAKNGGQTNFSVLVGRNVDTSNTSHVCPLIRYQP